MPVQQRVEISAPNIQTVSFRIRGTTPLVIHAFSAKAKKQIRDTQIAGDKAKINKKREPKDFKALFEEAKHIADAGWCGIPATAFRGAMISACRVAGLVMTRAKLIVFVQADGFDKADFTPLVKITKGEPTYFEAAVRLDNGSVDLCARPLWKPGWEAVLKVDFDADQISLQDVTNLLMRAGLEVGICEGRPDSKKSCGQGWGLFEIVQDKEKR